MARLAARCIVAFAVLQFASGLFVGQSPPSPGRTDTEEYPLRRSDSLYQGAIVYDANMSFFPTKGTPGTLKVTSEGVCDHDGYQPSELESRFKANANAWTSDAKLLCGNLGEQQHAWIRQIKGEEKPGPLFSKFCKKGEPPVLIEPLAGVLRDPRLICSETKTNHWKMLFSIEWLLLGDASLVQKGGSKIFFDAGGTHFTDALRFFSSAYNGRGITFDKVYVWEAQGQPYGVYWEGTTKEERSFWEPRVTFYNGVPVSGESGHEHNPVDRILKLCKPEDFCSFKLDIDTPSVEMPIVHQLLGHPTVGQVLDEFFFEHHVHGLMQGQGWGEAVNGTFADSYDIFTKLREMGVRSHSWI